MQWRRVLHPFGLALLGTSAVIALGVGLLAPWSGQALLILVWGFLGYGAALAATVVLQRGTKPPPEASPESVSPRSVPLNHSPVMTGPTVDWARLTEEALRRLKSPTALAQSGLVAALPHTLSGGAARGADVASPLANAQALREALLTAIEKLRPADGNDSSVQSQQYRILHEEYVIGRTTRMIMARLSISESTLHRYRREAIGAVASDLALREAQLSARTP